MNVFVIVKRFNRPRAGRLQEDEILTVVSEEAVARRWAENYPHFSTDDPDLFEIQIFPRELDELFGVPLEDFPPKPRD